MRERLDVNWNSAISSPCRVLSSFQMRRCRRRGVFIRQTDSSRACGDRLLWRRSFARSLSSRHTTTDYITQHLDYPRESEVNTNYATETNKLRYSENTCYGVCARLYRRILGRQHALQLVLTRRLLEDYLTTKCGRAGSRVVEPGRRRSQHCTRLPRTVWS